MGTLCAVMGRAAKTAVGTAWFRISCEKKNNDCFIRKATGSSI